MKEDWFDVSLKEAVESQPVSEGVLSYFDSKLKDKFCEGELNAKSLAQIAGDIIKLSEESELSEKSHENQKN